MDQTVRFLDALFDSGLLIETGVDGLYGRSAAFEDAINRVDVAGTDDAASSWEKALSEFDALGLM